MQPTFAVGRLAQWVQRNTPPTPVPLMTGFVYADLTSRFRHPSALLQKPFQLSDLLSRTNELLDPENPTVNKGRA